MVGVDAKVDGNNAKVDRWCGGSAAKAISNVVPVRVDRDSRSATSTLRSFRKQRFVDVAGYSRFESNDLSANMRRRYLR